MNNSYHVFCAAVCLTFAFLAACGKNSGNHSPPQGGDKLTIEPHSNTIQPHEPPTEGGSKRGPSSGQNQILQQKLMEEKKPDWLQIGPPRKLEALPPNGNAKPAVAATIPNAIRGSESVLLSGVSIKMPDDFTANGISDETKDGLVVLRRNTEARIYETKDGGLVQVPSIPLPRFNYGEPRRWFLSNWQWLDADNLVVISNEENPETDMISESRIYTYNIRTKTLQRAILPDALELRGEIKFMAARDGLIMVKNEGREIWFRFP